MCSLAAPSLLWPPASECGEQPVGEQPNCLLHHNSMQFLFLFFNGMDQLPYNLWLFCFQLPGHHTLDLSTGGNCPRKNRGPVISVCKHWSVALGDNIGFVHFLPTMEYDDGRAEPLFFFPWSSRDGQRCCLSLTGLLYSCLWEVCFKACTGVKWVTPRWRWAGGGRSEPRRGELGGCCCCCCL